MAQPTLTLLYDGRCPLCSWEMHNLMRRNQQGLLGFVDIQSAEFEASVYGVTMGTLMGRMHGITADGRMLVGVAALIACYRAVGWWWVYLPLSLIPRRLAERAYGWFADHRYTISKWFGHCIGGVCTSRRCRK